MSALHEFGEGFLIGSLCGLLVVLVITALKVGLDSVRGEPGARREWWR